MGAEGQEPSERHDTTNRLTVAVFDLDKTLTRYDTYLRYLLGFLRRHPARLVHCWRLPWDVLCFKARLRSNAWLKAQFLAAILGGYTDVDLYAWTAQFVDRVMATGMRPGAMEVLRHHQALGDRIVLLSASPDIFVQQFAARLQCSDCLCTCTERDAHGRLTGRLDGANCYGLEKLRRLEALLGPERPRWHVIAYADHHSDLSLIRWANDGVLVNPSRALRRIAMEWHVRVVAW